jgi:hypothetical protein
LLSSFDGLDPLSGKSEVHKHSAEKSCCTKCSIGRFRRRVGEQSRVAGFIWRLPRSNGDSASLHHPAYNVNDDAIIYGTSHWIKLVETTLAA